jgi:hypothetical protein
MQDRELQEPTWPKHPPRLLQNDALVGHVHQGHECRHEIEGVCLEWQRQGVACAERDAEGLGLLGLLGVPDEGRRDIHGMHACSEVRELPRVGALAASDIETTQAYNRWQHRKESRSLSASPYPART